MDGDFVVKTTRKTFNQISTVLVLEHINKVEKVTGGLLGITQSGEHINKVEKVTGGLLGITQSGEHINKVEKVTGVC